VLRKLEEPSFEEPAPSADQASEPEPPSAGLGNQGGSSASR
jgi:hypothetical protein